MKLKEFRLDDWTVGQHRGDPMLSIQNVDPVDLVECMDEELQRAVMKQLGEDMAVDVFDLELASEE